MSIFALLRRLERITRPAPSLAHDYDLPVQDVDDEVWAPTVPSRESLLDAWFYAKTPEVEKQAKDELDRYYPNFAGAAASLADGDSPHGVFCNPSVREDKQHGMRRDTQPGRADPHTTWHGDCFDHCVGHPETPQPSPVTTRTSAGDSSAAAGILPPTVAAEPLDEDAADLQAFADAIPFGWASIDVGELIAEAQAELAEWLKPAILDVLAEHTPNTQMVNGRYAITCAGDDDDDAHAYLPSYADWREHVADDLAPHIVKALRAQPK